MPGPAGDQGYGLRVLPGKREHDRLGAWLERFGRAWETRDPELAAALFSKDGSYRETPFDEPLTGSNEIRAYWSTLPRAREDIRFIYEILAAVEPWGIAHWRGSYTLVEPEMRVEIDGILLIALDGEGACREFREWSNRRESPVR